MRYRLSAALIIVGILISSSFTASAGPLGPNVLPAPVGHFQPRAQDFAPGSTANRVEQNRLSTFDAEQKKLDEQLDKKLDICRC
jgi:hypothetical protein